MDVRPHSADNCGADLVQVVYQRADQNLLVDKLIDEIVALNDDIKNECSSFLADVQCSIAFRATCFPLILRFKSARFASEQEWRLIKVFMSGDIIPDLKHRIVADAIAPYIALPIKSFKSFGDGPLPIEAIKIGPSPHQDLLFHSLGDFTQYHGYPVMMSISEVSLR